MSKEQLLEALRRQVALMKLEAQMQRDAGNNTMATDLMVDARYLSAAISNIEQVHSWVTMVKGK